MRGAQLRQKGSLLRSFDFEPCWTLFNNYLTNFKHWFWMKTSPASQPNSRLQASKLPAVRFRSSFWARQRDLTPRPMGQPNYPTVTAVGNPLKTPQPIDPIALVHPPGNGSGLGKCCGSKRTGRKSSRRTPWRDAHGITEQRIRPTISRGFIKMLCVCHVCHDVLAIGLNHPCLDKPLRNGRARRPCFDGESYSFP